MKILVIGDAIKDIYLRMDPRGDAFEYDEENVPWLNIAFDGSEHSYLKRTEIDAGVSVTKEVLSSYDHQIFCYAKTSENSYRYILTADNDNVNYITSAMLDETKFVEPEEPVDWIYVDRSAVHSDKLTANIISYMKRTPGAKLAIFAGAKIERRITKPMLDLMRVALVIFTDGNIPETTTPVWHITPTEIKFRDNIIHYKVNDNDLLTHLTSYSIIAATLFSYLCEADSITKEKEDAVRPKLTKEHLQHALQLAKINVENSTLIETLSRRKLEEKYMEENNKKLNLTLIAKELVANPKGILAADESGGSIHKKFEAAGIPDDEEHRRNYRNIFFTTSELEKYVNGVILFDETARQLSDDGNSFVDYLTNKSIIPGIKVDQGLKNFTDGIHDNEKWTSGLEGLPERLAEYYEMGARFAKWRAAFEVTFNPDNSIASPSDFTITENAKILAQYAKDCQEAGIVPVVEPEVVHDGNYTIDTCAMLTSKILDKLFVELKNADVNLSGCILKVNMVLAGAKNPNGESSPAEVGAATAKVLREHVPEELAGVVFLSGGQSVEQATENLQAVTNNGPFPWPVTFSYARALQSPALDAWQGKAENVEMAREAFKSRLIANTNALIKK